MEILIIFTIILLIYASIKDDIRDFEIILDGSRYMIIYKVKIFGFKVGTKTVEVYDTFGFPHVARFRTREEAYRFIYKKIKGQEDEHSLY